MTIGPEYRRGIYLLRREGNWIACYRHETLVEVASNWRDALKWLDTVTK
jgi:hypothetical protein